MRFYYFFLFLLVPLVNGNIFDSIGSAVNDAVGTLEDVGKTVADTLEDTGKTVADTLEDTGKTVAGTLEDTGKTVADTLEDTGKTVADTLEDTGKTVADTLEDTGKTVADTLEDTGKTVADTLEDTGKTVADTLEDTGKTVADTLEDTGKTVADTLEDTGKTVADTLEDTANTVADTMEDTYKDVEHAVVDAEDEVAEAFEDVGETVADTYKDVEGAVVDAVETVVDAVDSLSLDTKGCTCVGFNCGCCFNIEMEAVDLNSEVCVNVSYEPAPEYGASVSLSIDSKKIIDVLVSARNPPPICVNVPKLKRYASVCLRFSKLTVTDNSFSGCLSFEARLIKVLKQDVLIGCFKIQPDGAKMGRPITEGQRGNVLLKKPLLLIHDTIIKGRQSVDKPTTRPQLSLTNSQYRHTISLVATLILSMISMLI